jgi:hypothetical protein
MSFVDRYLKRSGRTLNLGLHIVDGVRRLHLKGDSLAREGLHEDLHGGLGIAISKVQL